MHLVALLRAAIYPLVVASQTIPIVMIAPLLVFWLGFGLLPELVVVALVSFFSIVVTTLDALAAVDPELLKLMRTFDGIAAADVPPRRASRRAARACSPAPRSRSSSSAIGAVFAEQANGSTSGARLSCSSRPPANS